MRRTGVRRSGCFGGVSLDFWMDLTVLCLDFWIKVVSLGAFLRIESLCFPSGFLRDAFGMRLYITLPFIIILNATLIYDTWSSSIILLFYLMLFRQLLKMQPVNKNPKNISFSYVIYVYLCSTILRQPNSITTLEIINQKADKGSYVCLYKQ